MRAIGAPIKVFAVWERVLTTDWRAPGESVMGLLPDARVAQFWDDSRVLSQYLGERDDDRQSIVWDWVGIYPPGMKLREKPLYEGRPVVRVAEEFRLRLQEAIQLAHSRM